MGPWDAMDNPTVPWHHGMGWTVGHTRICRGTGGHPMECPTVPWESVEGQVDIPWNVPLSHGTCGMGWTIYGVSGHL